MLGNSFVDLFYMIWKNVCFLPHILLYVSKTLLIVTFVYRNTFMYLCILFLNPPTTLLSKIQIVEIPDEQTITKERNIYTSLFLYI